MNTSATAAPRSGRSVTVSRDVVVTAREQVSERMLRLTLGGDDLAPAVHDSPGSWVKLFVPSTDGHGEHGRAYTVRGFNPIRDEIDVDVFLHGGGTMPRWAGACRIGDLARIGGPRPSGAPTRTATSLLLLGDETSLPAISAILEREHSARPIQAFIETGARGDRQELDVPAHTTLTWLHRSRADAPGSLLAAAASRTRFGPGTGVWFAAEAASAKQFRRTTREREVAGLHVQGYWRSGIGDYRE
ncbi:hypothetical protein ASE14_18675 [Agromyces sp. Root81]|uniref:siderophore-interacting protein n=1 Tax=Agromyces sp. Root81 TaxID=1736601 RepID=UPI0006FA3FD3|nr:siderophore-interacting protein [Agromyces sp. Root81]KRC58586.1 hypothetical protein ASE14_18675 [Agromyces sp. Root81]